MLKPKNERIVAPSLLSCDLMQIGVEANSVLKAGAQWLHLDVMDGHFVPNLTFGLPVLELLRKMFPQVWIDCHIMVSNPDQVFDGYLKGGVSSLCIPIESLTHAHRVFADIRKAGVAPAVAINPGTSLNAIEALLTSVDYVNVMGVNPGFSGQKFIFETVDRVMQLKSMIDRRGLDVRIQVDGGVDEQTVGLLVEAGADIFVSGNYVFKHASLKEAIKILKGS